MILYIDATDFNKVTFGLAKENSRQGDRVGKQSYKIDPHKSHQLLETLEKFLKENQNPKRKIQKIIINKGPGSYTGVRISAAISQALSLAWKIPVIAITSEKFKI